jgi:hypothetical protein
MIDVLILGQPYWASHLARALTSRADDIRATFIPQRRYLRLLASPPRSGRVVLVRAGYRVGATTPRGRLFDAYWSLLRRLLPGASACHYWLGTDVMDTVNEAQAGTLRWRAVSATQDDLHLADAPWLSDELRSVGIQATTAHLPKPNPAPPAAPPLSSQFSVLTYLPGHRFDFYGGETTLEVARRLPDIRFDVVGRQTAAARSAPPNIRWHGWVADMTKHYADTTVVVRIPRHDGLGETVVEGLLNARHVVYTYQVPFVRQVSPATPDTLVSALEEFQDAYANGRLGLNLAGRAYALKEFDEARLADHVIALIRARA